MANRRTIGGVIHRYQKYDPKRFPSPTQPPPDVVSPAMEHLLRFGHTRHLTDEELAQAIRLDPGQIRQLGPPLEHLIAMLEERKRKILEKYETESVRKKAADAVAKHLDDSFNPAETSDDVEALFRQRFHEAIREEQIHDLEKLWYVLPDERSRLARQIVLAIESLGQKYEIEELAARYEFVGREAMTIEKALEVLQELRKIDELLEQLKRAMDTAQLAVIDMDALESMVEQADLEELQRVQKIIEEAIRELAEQQGLESAEGSYRLTPRAFRIFQSRLLEKIFSQLDPGRSGRHISEKDGEGAVELPQSRPYEFGDSAAQMDIPQSFINALIRHGKEGAGENASDRIRIRPDDIEVHRTKNRPKCATVVVMDMSGSMRYDGQYVNVKRMALAIDGLIRSEYPGDFLGFVEMYSFARIRQSGEIARLLPKPVTVTDPIVQMSFDMSDENVTESMVHPHFTNIQHGLQQARRLLSVQNTPNRQIILITDGLPTAHFQQERLFLLYPPHPLTESATLGEGLRCQQEGITINLFLVPSWSQSQEDIQFAYRLAESTRGRVFFTAGNDLDRFVVWDYVNRRRSIIG